MSCGMSANVMDKTRRRGSRYEAGQIELEGGTGGIVQMVGCADYLEIYKVDRTFRVKTPETLDPDETNPDMMWVVEQAAEVGSQNPVVARVLLQGKEMLDSALLAPKVDKDDIVQALHAYKETLLACDREYEHIKLKIEGEVDRVRRESLATQNRGRVVAGFPHVADLESHATSFLTFSKRCIQQQARIFDLFFGTQIYSPHFHKIREWIAENLSKESPLHSFFEDQEPRVKYVLSLRNGLEHPVPGPRTVIENFRLAPDGEIHTPRWYLEGEVPRPILEESDALRRSLLKMVETLVILSALERTESDFPYVVYTIPKGERRKECPMKYRLSVDLERLKVSSK